MNNKILKTTKIVGALVLAGVVSNVTAIGTNIPVEVTVKNAFNITATPLKFGSIIATNSSTGVATLVFDPQFGNAIPAQETTGPAKINILAGTAKELGTIKVDGAAGETNLQIKTNAETYKLIPAGGIGATFEVSKFMVFDTVGVGALPKEIKVGAVPMKTQADGTLTLNVGATLSTMSDGTATVYQDKVYSTVMTFDISY